ncbi:hypothetical protein LOZ36_001143 [Ophidiomyces ophidiicola]|nr:hypothetical protein LOZ36_001143 [Ophidiomyces ophidiicola]
MVKTRRLMRREITYSSAKTNETNMLVSLGYYSKLYDFFLHLYRHENLLKQAAAHHLGVNPERCEVALVTQWLFGSFNVCIPIVIDTQKSVLMRFPLPHRVGESFRPGNSDEKLRCEAGTYTWLQQNCPSIPIPRLYGFAFSTGQSFTAIENMPLIARCVQSVRCFILRMFGFPVTKYVPYTGPCLDALKTGYLLVERIENGSMLSKTWKDKRDDQNLRMNFFRSLSRILLTIARVPVPRIGSFTIDHNGFLNLNNRPLTIEIQQMENEHIPVGIPRDATYSTSLAYAHDILALHDNRLRYQPNGANDKWDCLHQMATLTMMRILLPHFFNRQLNHGPFTVMLNDLHPSNI